MELHERNKHRHFWPRYQRVVGGKKKKKPSEKLPQSASCSPKVPVGSSLPTRRAPTSLSSALGPTEPQQEGKKHPGWGGKVRGKHRRVSSQAEESLQSSVGAQRCEGHPS